MLVYTCSLTQEILSVLLDLPWKHSRSTDKAALFSSPDEKTEVLEGWPSPSQLQGEQNCRVHLYCIFSLN